MQATIFLAIWISAGLAPAADPPAVTEDVRVFPAHSDFDGVTIGDWLARWWQWAMSIPKDRNPLFDTTGQFCHEDQPGPVFFLAGRFCCGTAERTCSVPAGMPILVPLFNCENYNNIFKVPPDNFTRDQLVADCAAPIDEASVLQCEVDGGSVTDLLDHRETFQDYTVVFPDNNVVGNHPGAYPGAICDGYVLLLEPLAAGDHTVHWKAAMGDPQNPSWWIEVTFHLVVAEPRFRRGDATGDAAVDLSDAIGILGFLFLGDRKPGCMDAADTDDSGAVDLTDAVYLLMRLFLAGDPIPDPGPDSCGRDPTEDELRPCLYWSC